MPIFKDITKPIEKLILNSPLHGLLSDDRALITFTDKHTGRPLSISVGYQKEDRIVRIICPRADRCWDKFKYGSPVTIRIRGITYQGWAQLIEDPEEALMEWKALFKRKPELAEKFDLERGQDGEIISTELPAVLKEFTILRFEISRSV